MKLLITGGTGFLGRRTAGYFLGLGHEVLAPDHSRLDITDRDSVRAWFRENRPEAVIHTAAVSDTGRCQQQPRWSETINVDGCVHLAESCREFGGKLVICSSDQVYAGSPAAGPHREEEALKPGNVYGGQKLRAEQRCLDICPEAVCLRLSWMYAADSYPGEHGHFLTILRAAINDSAAPLTWPVHDRRGLTDVKDVMENLPLALRLPGGVYNFGSENRENTYETIKRVLQALGMDMLLARLTPNEEAFARDPRDISMDLTKTNAAGIFFPTTEEGLIRVLKGETCL